MLGFKSYKGVEESFSGVMREPNKIEGDERALQDSHWINANTTRGVLCKGVS